MKRKHFVVSLIIVGLTFIALLIGGRLSFRLDSKTLKGKENIQNIKKIDIGMTYPKVLKIMGEPDTIVPPHLNNPFYQLEYETNYTSFAAVTIVMDDTTGSVVDKEEFPEEYMSDYE